MGISGELGEYGDKKKKKVGDEYQLVEWIH
jgi:hypothetical protein